jgi:hypothetical protein
MKEQHMKTYKLFFSILLIGILELSCSQGTKKTTDKQIVSEPDRKSATDINSSQIHITTGLRLATFDVDATPPMDSRLLPYNLNTMINTWDMGLRAKGIVLLGAGQPIVLCSIDWATIGNESQDEFKNALAKAAATIPERVAVHTVQQHDALWCDFSIEKILIKADINPMYFESSFPREVIRRLETGVRNSLDNSQPITHIGLGEAQVYQVASNRRILGADGHVRAGRMSSCKDSTLRAEPEGVIDPIVSLVSFWNAGKPLAVLSYYATHPQSYYATGVCNPDFVGIARFFRQLAVPDALHVHFSGAAGNIAAGKYNDGKHENRLILAERLADGMKRAWEASKREPITADEVSWKVIPVALPPTKHQENLQRGQQITPGMEIECIAARLAFQERCKVGKRIDLACLTLGRARILHTPGEMFIEYQLAAKAERKDLFVTMANLGDDGPGYIATAIAYKQGGYEAGSWSFVSPEAEEVLMTAIRKLLRD